MCEWSRQNLQMHVASQMLIGRSSSGWVLDTDIVSSSLSVEHMLLRARGGGACFRHHDASGCAADNIVPHRNAGACGGDA